MFHPRLPPPGGTNWTDEDFEFIELQNTGGEAIGLAGLRFTQSITFDFTQGAVKTLGPNEIVLVVKNLAAFASRYPGGPLGRSPGSFQRVYSFPLKTFANGGEEVRLEDGLGRKVVDFNVRQRAGLAPGGGRRRAFAGAGGVRRSKRTGGWTTAATGAPAPCSTARRAWRTRRRCATWC